MSEDAGGSADDESGDGAPTEADVERLFEEADVDGDAEEPWAELGDDAEAPSGGADLFADLAEESPTDHVSPDVEGDAEEAVVPKNRYCQRCEFFSEPPEVACRNPGTEIVEVADDERFRVRNCPIVEERQGTVDVLDME